jgi:hypothetical protein
MNEADNSGKSWWQTLPAYLSAIATLIVAITGVITFIYIYHPVTGGKGKNRLPFPVDAYGNCTTPLQHDNMYQTGIKFQQGEGMSISANGDWVTSKGRPSTSTSDANGIERTIDLTGVGIPIGALVGKIGKGDVFFIGKKYEQQAKDSGELYLGYWDNYCPDNEGSVSVTVVGGN